MKLTNTQIANRKSGVTLLELTVVILVLLTLIGILFVGVNAWRKGSDRAANVLNLRNTQQAMRGYANTTNQVAPVEFLSTSTSVGLQLYMTLPDAPDNMSPDPYDYTEEITPYSPTPYDDSLAHLYMTGPAPALPAAASANVAYSLAEPAETAGW